MTQALELPTFDYQPQPYRGPSAEEVLRLRRRFLNPGIFLYYKQPLMIVEGKGQYVFDEKGRRYLDALGGIVTISIGHCHPDVVEAARRQNELLQHATTIYLHPNIAEYAQKLAAKMPGGLPSGIPGAPGAPGLPPTMPGLPPTFPGGGGLPGLGGKLPTPGGLPPGLSGFGKKK